MSSNVWLMCWIMMEDVWEQEWASVENSRNSNHICGCEFGAFFSLNNQNGGRCGCTINFIQDVYFQIEQIRSAITFNNMNEVKLWQMRLKTSVNASLAIHDGLQRFPNAWNEHTEVFQNNLTRPARQYWWLKTKSDKYLRRGPTQGFKNWKDVAHLFGFYVKTLRWRRV